MHRLATALHHLRIDPKERSLPDEPEHGFDDECHLCRGDYPDEFVEMILAAKPMGKRMSADQFTAWLRQIDEEPAPKPFA